MSKNSCRDSASWPAFLHSAFFLLSSLFRWLWVALGGFARASEDLGRLHTFFWPSTLDSRPSALVIRSFFMCSAYFVVWTSVLEFSGSPRGSTWATERASTPNCIVGKRPMKTATNESRPRANPLLKTKELVGN